jgi:pantoate--beta-alanine ligase
MITVADTLELRQEVARARRAGKRVGFVPTMGHLHAGHLQLIQVAQQNADFVVASIYVNPMQFGPSEDFAAYPRTPEADQLALAGAGANLIFTPSDTAMYPRGVAAQTFVEVPGLGDILCGAFRPGHFRGVTTVVNRLFNLVQPDVAVFGKKDYQQLFLVRRMVDDLGMPIDIIGVKIVREPDGLALSSRNVYLQPHERQVAPRLFQVLCAVRDEIRTGRTPPVEASKQATDDLRRAGFRPDYVQIVRQRDLMAAQMGDRELVIIAAAWLGRTRLIDNIELVIDSN